MFSWFNHTTRAELRPQDVSLTKTNAKTQWNPFHHKTVPGIFCEPIRSNLIFREPLTTKKGFHRNNYREMGNISEELHLPGADTSAADIKHDGRRRWRSLFREQRTLSAEKIADRQRRLATVVCVLPPRITFRRSHRVHCSCF